MLSRHSPNVRHLTLIFLFLKSSRPLSTSWSSFRKRTHIGVLVLWDYCWSLFHHQLLEYDVLLPLTFECRSLFGPLLVSIGRCRYHGVRRCLVYLDFLTLYSGLALTEYARSSKRIECSFLTNKYSSETWPPLISTPALGKKSWPSSSKCYVFSAL